MPLLHIFWAALIMHHLPYDERLSHLFLAKQILDMNSTEFNLLWLYFIDELLLFFVLDLIFSF